MATITVSVNPKVFGKGVSTAKQLGGKFDGTTKTWVISAEAVKVAMGGDTLNTPAEWLGYRGLRVVAAAPAKREQHDGGCAGHWGGACECRS
jgi:hypothetical protein